MNPEQPKQYTPKEIAEIEKSRTISDAELLKGGAEYVVDEEKMVGQLIVPTEEQIRNIHLEMMKMRSEVENKAYDKLFSYVLENMPVDIQKALKRGVSIHSGDWDRLKLNLPTSVFRAYRYFYDRELSREEKDLMIKRSGCEYGGPEKFCVHCFNQWYGSGR